MSITVIAALASLAVAGLLIIAPYVLPFLRTRAEQPDTLLARIDGPSQDVVNNLADQLTKLECSDVEILVAFRELAAGVPIYLIILNIHEKRVP